MEEALGLFRRLLDEAQTRHDIAAADYQAALEACGNGTGTVDEMGYKSGVYQRASVQLYARKDAVETLEAELARKQTPSDATLVP